ncbi:MAG: hypothetical protein ISR65_20055 [Bacteriovoracaceae bacterium]|nr:hypothetical protein [Bacteriovoracaceae bacterium]
MDDQKNKPNRPNKPKAQNETHTSSQHKKHKPKRSNFSYNKNKRYSKSNRSNKNTNYTSLDGIFKKYDHLLELYTIARRKYYDHYYRGSKREQEKLKRNYYSAISALARFEKALYPDKRRALHRRNDSGSIDNTYSTIHNLDNKKTSINPDTAQSDIHQLQSQQSVSYKDDLQETVGTMEDYKKLKGLT